MLREEEILAVITGKYGVCQQLTSRWKSEFVENMIAVFDKKANEAMRLKAEHEAETEALASRIGQLTPCHRKRRQVLYHVHANINRPLDWPP